MIYKQLSCFLVTAVWLTHTIKTDFTGHVCNYAFDCFIQHSCKWFYSDQARHRNFSLRFLTMRSFYLLPCLPSLKESFFQTFRKCQACSKQILCRAAESDEELKQMEERVYKFSTAFPMPGFKINSQANGQSNGYHWVLMFVQFLSCLESRFPVCPPEEENVCTRPLVLFKKTQ